jgi:multidrug efflux pump subunit AcrB
LRNIPGTKNITNSSEESPGQFVFKLDKSKLAKLGLTPSTVGPQLYLALNGMKA